MNTPTPPVGVIESLSQGFEATASHLLLVLLPLLLDLALWLGPRVSYAPAITGFIDAYRQDIWTPVVQGSNAELDATWPEVADMLSAALGGESIQYLPAVGVPSLLAARDAASLPFGYTPPTWTLHTLGELLGARLLVIFVSVIIGTMYVILIAQQIGDGGLQPLALVARLPAMALQIMILGIVIPIVFLIILTPFTVLALGLGLMSDVLARGALWLGMLLFLWASLFGVFTIHGMLMNRRHLLAALWDSIRVVQWNISATLFLMLAVLLLDAALGYVWSLPEGGSWLVLAAIAGHAFFSTGLVAATFVFFKDRYRHWREMRTQLLALLEQERVHSNDSRE